MSSVLSSVRYGVLRDLECSVISSFCGMDSVTTVVACCLQVPH